MANEEAVVFPVDRKLHQVNRGGLAFLLMVADVLMILWLVEAWEDLHGDTAIDATWIASGIVRMVSFLGMTVTAFYATFGSQPKGGDKTEGARPGYRQVRLRVVAGVFAVLFFGDMAASSVATEGAGFVDIFHAALLGVLVLASVITISVGRALLRLWRDTGEVSKVPVWRELTEFQTGKVLPSLGLHTAWLLVFFVSWWGRDGLHPMLDLGDRDASSGLTLAVEGAALAVIGLLFVVKREKVLAGVLDFRVHPRIDLLMGILGAILSVELSLRLFPGHELCSGAIFCVTLGACALGFLAAAISVVRAARYVKKA